MKLSEVKETLDASVIVGHDKLDTQVAGGAAARTDQMSAAHTGMVRSVARLCIDPIPCSRAQTRSSLL